MSFQVLVLLVALALAFDFMNGFHDAANSIATVVSTRVLRPHYAVAWAAFFNFIAFLFFGLNVANTIGTGVIDPGLVDVSVILGALSGAIAWNAITWWFGLPSSSSHALIGGLAGGAVAKGGGQGRLGRGFLTTSPPVGRRGQGRRAGAHRQRIPQDQPRDRALAAPGLHARRAPDDGDRLDFL